MCIKFNKRWKMSFYNLNGCWTYPSKALKNVAMSRRQNVMAGKTQSEATQNIFILILSWFDA